ncbi:MAG: TIGR01777 family oxidoreductase [Calditrichota bacterium]
MKIIITGATGMLGRPLCAALLEDGHHVIALSRSPERASQKLGSQVTCLKWDGKTVGEWADAVDGSDGIVNLAGENIAGSRWTEAYKKRIIDSRVNAGNAVAEAIQSVTKKPSFLIQASATGYYGEGGDTVLTEDSPLGDTFLAEVVDRWEKSVSALNSSSIRVAFPRIGVVLGKEGGIVDKLRLPFQMFVGGPPGDGQQYISWIHIKDVVDAIRFLIHTESTSGRYNLTAPNPVRMTEFSKAFGAALGRPSWLPVPAFALKLALQQMAEETALISQCIQPNRLLEAGFSFSFPDVNVALKDQV